ncbi:39S ribosomal protein L21, mitochondrial [Anthophora plagiata]
MATLTSFTRLFNFAANTCIRRILPATAYKQYYPALKLWEVQVAGHRTRYRLPWFNEPPSIQEEVPEPNEEKEKAAADVFNEINRQVATNSTGRLFAVIRLCGIQYKITESDIIVVEDFTLIGRPLLNRELVSIDATVIQKTLSHTITRFRMKKRKQFRRMNFYKVYRTMVRINSITINADIDKKKEVEGLDRIY